MRRRTVAVTRWAGWCGVDPATVAHLIGISLATLRDWTYRWRHDRLEPRRRGAPVETLSYDQRVFLLSLLHALGPTVSRRRFAELAPSSIPRRECDRFLDRYRFVVSRTQGQAVVQALRWLDAGSVWAMDFTTPDAPVEGRYPYLLIIRDLASGYQLAALPTEDASCAPVVACLSQLFAAYGAPLVLKSDNGPHFTGDETQTLLAEHAVTWLPSPCYCPTYNGSCEAGVGSIKTRAHHCATRNDRPEQWTCDDVEAARMEANESGRPRGAEAPAPDLAWRRRTPITPAERVAFARELDDLRHEAEAEYRAAEDIPYGESVDDLAALRLERQVITRTLIACNLLTIRRRRITLPDHRRWGRKIA